LGGVRQRCAGRPLGKLKEAAEALYQRLPGGDDPVSKAFAKAARNRVAEVWPENWPALQLFLEVGTQWRFSMNGREGLDYSILFRRLDDKGLSRDEWEQFFADIQHLELAALNASREQ
jgi:hypothetical protein